MNTITIRVAVRAVAAMSLAVNAVMAQQAGADNSPATFKGPIKVFILAGQSNMEGQGSVDHDCNSGKGNLVWSMVNSKSAEKMKQLKNEKGEWVVRDDVQISFKVGDKVRKGGLTVGYTGYAADGSRRHIGPELGFGFVTGDMLDFRKAQEEGTRQIKNALFIKTTDFARPAELSPCPPHGHHWFANAESYLLICDALGEGMKKLLN